jgi:selenocysteine lyase/cysteine desulfurase
LRLDTLFEGGTGSESASPDAPENLPDRYEAGTPNTPGVAGLRAGVEVVLEQGVDVIGARERALADRLRRRLADVEGVRLAGPPAGAGAAPVVSVEVVGMSSAETAFVMDRAFGIAVRAGLHCCPEAHRVAGTLEQGLVRCSVGHATTEADVDAAAEALTEITIKIAAKS